MFESFLRQALDQGTLGYLLTILVPLFISTIYGLVQRSRANQTQKENEQLDAKHQQAETMLTQAITSGVHMVLANRDINIDQTKFDAIAEAASEKLIDIADKARIPVDEIVDKVSALHGVSDAPPAAPKSAASVAPTASKADPPKEAVSDGKGPYKFNGVPAGLSYGQRVQVSISPAPTAGVLALYESDEKQTEGAMIEFDETTKVSPDSTLTFKIPAIYNPLAKRYRPGYYLLYLRAQGPQGEAFVETALLKLA